MLQIKPPQKKEGFLSSSSFRLGFVSLVQFAFLLILNHIDQYIKWKIRNELATHE